MPLMAGSSPSVNSQNIREMQAAGHPHAQAVAAALRNADRTRAMGGMMPQPMGSLGHPMPSGGIRPVALPRTGVHLGMHPSSMLPRRDGGGSVGAPVAPTPGLQPNVSNANPALQNYIQKFSAMPPEQLQEMIARMGTNSPIAGIAQRVLQQKMVMPAAPAPTPTAQPTPLSLAVPTQQAFQPQPIGMSPAQPVQQAARGGKAGERRDTVPILAAGGEFVVSPEHVAHIGEGDVKEGHRRLDDFVIQRRKQIIKEMRALRPPVGSKAAKA